MTITSQTPCSDPGMNRAITEALDQIGEVENAKYDGLRGKLPNWLPTFTNEGFERRRKHLMLRMIREGELNYFLDNWDRYRQSRNPLPVDPAWEHDFDFFVDLWDQVQRGRDEGTERLCGKDAVRGRVYEKPDTRRREANDKRKQEADQRKELCINKAAELKAQFPHLQLPGKKSSLSRLVIKELGQQIKVKENTVRKYI